MTTSTSEKDKAEINNETLEAYFQVFLALANVELTISSTLSEIAFNYTMAENLENSLESTIKNIKVGYKAKEDKAHTTAKKQEASEVKAQLGAILEVVAVIKAETLSLIKNKAKKENIDLADYLETQNRNSRLFLNKLDS